jgi:uncharacterized protein YjiS (DUF1127 family)
MMTVIDKTMQGRVTTQRQGLRAVWLVVKTWAARRHARQTLARLDDHVLRDIGLTRTTAAKECAKPFWTK